MNHTLSLYSPKTNLIKQIKKKNHDYTKYNHKRLTKLENKTNNENPKRNDKQNDSLSLSHKKIFKMRGRLGLQGLSYGRVL